MNDAKRLMNVLNNMMPLLDELPTMTRERMLTMLRIAYLCGYEMHRAECIAVKKMSEEEQ